MKWSSGPLHKQHYLWSSKFHHIIHTLSIATSAWLGKSFRSDVHEECDGFKLEVRTLNHTLIFMNRDQVLCCCFMMVVEEENVSCVLLLKTFYSERTNQFLYNELMGFFTEEGQSGRTIQLQTQTVMGTLTPPPPPVCGQLQWFIWVLLCVCVCANWAFYRNWYTLTMFTCLVSLDLSDDRSSLTSLS